MVDVTFAILCAAVMIAGLIIDQRRTQKPQPNRRPPVTFAAVVAQKHETCAECLELGLPPMLIHPNESYIQETTENGLRRYCMDCWNREVGSKMFEIS